MHKKIIWVSFDPELLKSVTAPGWKPLSQSDRIRINREAFIRLTGPDFNDLIKVSLRSMNPYNITSSLRLGHGYNG